MTRSVFHSFTSNNKVPSKSGYELECNIDTGVGDASRDLVGQVEVVKAHLGELKSGCAPPRSSYGTDNVPFGPIP